METRLLENSIAKICGLLAVGFGEAGSEIIAANIRRGGEIDPMIPGKKVVAIFGFCDIRQFTDTTEVLQEGVMEFVNTIGKIVHMETHLHGGSANKNVGDAFLLVWKFPAEVTLEDVERPELAPPGRRAAVAKVCEGALASFVAIIAGLRRSAKLNAYSNDARLAARMPDFEVKMGFGLHVGWAIEGAIGSEYKVDASYLSPNVNLSARLEAATKQFDVPILISERFVNACGASVARACRQIDRVTVKGSEEPMGVFTFDVAHDAAPAPDAPEDPERLFTQKKTHPASERARLAPDAASNEGTNVQSHSFYKYDDAFAEHPDLVAMRRGVTEEFLEKFRAAFALYQEGRWAEAASALRPAAAGAWRRDAKGRPVEDGPAKALLRHMEACAFEAPAEWSGFRALTEK
jgi:class 3 adenylate cyclase